jgi:hypothetical protein
MTVDLDDLRRAMAGRSTAELISILRNRDKKEWRPEVFEIVASVLRQRDVSPDAVISLGPESVDIVEADDLVTVERFFSPTDAHVHRAALEQAGLPAWVCDEVFGVVYGVGARLQVRARDEAAARALLEARPPPASAVPPECAQAPGLARGSSEVSQSAATRLLLRLIAVCFGVVSYAVLMLWLLWGTSTMGVRSVRAPLASVLSLAAGAVGVFASAQLWRLRENGRRAMIAMCLLVVAVNLVQLRSVSARSIGRLAVVAGVMCVLLSPSARRSCV